MPDSEIAPPSGTLPTSLGAATLRPATRDDLPAVVALLAADQLATPPEATDDLAPYVQAFQAIDRDPAHLLLVGEIDGEVIATMQVSFLPGLARRGAWRAEIEGVRVHTAHRGHGIGAAMIRWAVQEAGRRGCTLVQLTTNKQRTDAHRFYARLGFAKSHEGFKLAL
jgi:GNAT superfamily N-acetyltransferase